MSEKIHIQSEAPLEQAEHQTLVEHHEQREHHKSHEAAREAQHESLKTSRQDIERHAQSAEDLKRLDKSSDRNNSHTPHPTRELQAMARDRILRSVRRKLPAPQRVLSSFVHTKPVEAVSAVGEKTIARPYGLLGGGLSAFIGTTLTFYMAKHYGFRYNLFLFFTFFVAGYIIATVLEATVRIVRRNR